MRSFLTWCGILGVSLAIAVAALEALARQGLFEPKVRELVIDSAGGPQLEQKEPEVYNIPASKIPMELPDGRLGHRPNPKFIDHDWRGFRNEVDLKQADIVVLGDSQTYSINVTREDAWPQQMGRILGRSTYQLAYGGYGPGHYVQLLKEGLEMAPKVVIAAIYFGNDNLDNYWFTYNAREEKFHRTVDTVVLDGFKTNDQSLKDQIARAEVIDPWHKRHIYLDCQGMRKPPHANYQTVLNILDVPPLTTTNFAWRGQRLLKRLETRFELAHVIDVVISSRMTDNSINWTSPICVPFKHELASTLFSPGYRLLTLTRTDPRVVEGGRIGLLSIKNIAERTRRAGAKLYIMLIPTKELAFREIAEPALQGKEPLMTELWREEDYWRGEVRRVATEEDATLIDILPVYQEMIRNGKNPYQPLTRDPRTSGDGHPLYAGYHAIAVAAAERIRQVQAAAPGTP